MRKGIGFKKLQKSELIVYLPGVFDLFHVGHLMAIQKAKGFGGFLVVGVQSSESVHEQKNRWPIINTEDRKQILFNIKGVDWVIAYEHPNQTNVLNVLKPNILAVNETYGIDDIHQAVTLKSAKKLGIKIVRIAYTYGISTTSIREQIKWNPNLRK